MEDEDRRLRFGLAFQSYLIYGSIPSVDDITQFARNAEGGGFSSLWVPDHICCPIPFMESLTTLTVMVASTRRIRVGTSILVLPLRDPVPLAKMLTNIDILSGGRLTVGVGSGHYETEFRACGIPFEYRGKRMAELVKILRRLWTGREVGYSGDFYHIHGASIQPGPVQSGGPPIWMGSFGSKSSLQRVATLADGWLPSAGYTTQGAYKEQLAKIEDYARSVQAGRPNPIRALMIATYLSDTTREAKRLARPLVRSIYEPHSFKKGNTEEIEDLLLIGSPEDCRSKIEGWVDVGVEHFILWPLLPSASQVAALTREIIPHYN